MNNAGKISQTNVGVSSYNRLENKNVTKLRAP